MSQEYTIHTIDPGKQPFKDRNGNQWVNVLFEGDLSTPTKWVMKPENVAKFKPGDKVYGRIEQVEGKNYQRFYKEQKPDYQGGNQASGSSVLSSKSNYTANPEQQESIARSVALKAAVDLISSFSEDKMKSYGAIEELSKKFLAWLQGSSETQNGQQPTDIKTAYNNMKRDDRDEDAEIRSMMENMPEEGYLP